MGRQHVAMMLALASAFTGPRFVPQVPGPDRTFGRTEAEIERERKDKRLLREARNEERLRAKMEKSRLKRERKGQDAAVG